MAPNSPYRTSSDLVLQVLSNTGVLAVGQNIDVDDFAIVNNKLDSIIRKLAGLEIVYVADINNIPGAWFDDLADIVSGECASALGIVADEYTKLVNKGLGGAAGTNVMIGAGTAAQSLKIMTRGRPTFEPLRFVNY
jgi:hypothetical protein